MLTWDDISKWGRRASDTGATLPAAPQRDVMLEAVIAHEQIDVLFQPLIEPGTGYVVAAEALARSRLSPEQRCCLREPLQAASPNVFRG